MKKEELTLKEKSPAKEANVAKDYEDVSNMLKRMQVRKKDQSDQGLYKSPLEDEIDAVDDEDIDLFGDDEEGYIEMEEKEPLYERVQFPFTTPVASPPPEPAITGQGNFSSIDEYLRAAERAVRRARFED